MGGKSTKHSCCWEDQAIDVVVTGGSGFIGSHVVETLLANGARVACLLRKGRSPSSWIRHLPVTFLETDFSDATTLAPLLSHADFVYHIAGATKGRSDADFRRANVEPTRVLVQALRNSKRIRKFCLISSLTAVGPTPPGIVWNEESPCKPRTPYGRSKLDAEKICRDAAPDLPVVIIRPPAVYGPRDRDIWVMLQWLQRGISPRMGPRRKQLSLIHVRDLTRAIISATVSPTTNGQEFFVADPSPYWYEDLTALCAQLLRKNFVSIPVPRFIASGLAGFVEFLSVFSSKQPLLNSGKVHDLYASGWTCSPEKIERTLGFRSEISIEDGLRETIEWYRTEKWL